MTLGKFDPLDRLVQLLLIVAGLSSLANGLFMLVRPLEWYVFIPTVVTTGPPNAHFIRDIGLAYLGSGLILLYAAVHPKLRWKAALVGGLWLTLHGGLHVYEVAAGICGPATFWADAPGVIGQPALVLIALTILVVRQRIAPAGIPPRLFARAVDQATHGMSPHMADLVAAPGCATEKYQHFMPVTLHRHAAPPPEFHAARIGATLAADCGPCALLAAEGAVADGVDRSVVNRLLAGAPPSELADAFAFGRAVGSHDPAADAYGAGIESALGRPARFELALTAATVTAYPALKRGLGYASACALHKLEV
ncbi:MAG: hypothetical protein U0S50_18245 [Sphingopyxis sp.]|uniref:hypothetical protein n=1 Tax=Sphingopyxis sp. TaxID=1908224 RepID=UPI002AB94149|nr:hypothetical protein [Sphingopyxis sp.]MDZ3833731.1 hypothetical protein [Sphingopyxis sp.]